jgi:hypothetical protein
LRCPTTRRLAHKNVLNQPPYLDVREGKL